MVSGELLITSGPPVITRFGGVHRGACHIGNAQVARQIGQRIGASHPDGENEHYQYYNRGKGHVRQVIAKEPQPIISCIAAIFK